MNRQWICIRGRRLLVTEFIHILDSYRCRQAWNRETPIRCRSKSLPQLRASQRWSDPVLQNNLMRIWYHLKLPIFSTKFSGHRHYDRRLCQTRRGAGRVNKNFFFLHQWWDIELRFRRILPEPWLSGMLLSGRKTAGIKCSNRYGNFSVVKSFPYLFYMTTNISKNRMNSSIYRTIETVQHMIQ